MVSVVCCFNFHFIFLCLVAFYFGYLQCLPVPVWSVLYKNHVYKSLTGRTFIINMLLENHLKTTLLLLVAIISRTIYHSVKFGLSSVEDN